MSEHTNNVNRLMTQHCVAAGGIGICGSYVQRFFLLLVRLAAPITYFTYSMMSLTHVCRCFCTCTDCEGRHEEGRGYLTSTSKHEWDIECVRLCIWSAH